MKISHILKPDFPPSHSLLWTKPSMVGSGPWAVPPAFVSFVLALVCFAISSQATLAELFAPQSLVVAEPYDSGSDVVTWLSWDDVNSGATAYSAEVSTNGVSFAQAGLTGIGEKTYKLRIPYGIKQWARVRAVSGTDFSSYSPVAQVVGVAPPSRLAAQSTNISSVMLAWRDNSLNEQGFRLERSKDDGASFTIVGTVGVGVTLFEDVSVQQNERYHYRVSSFVALGQSQPTSLVEIAPGLPPDPPVDVEAYTINESVNGVSSTSVLITWADASLTETGWRVDQRAESGEWMSIGAYSHTYSGKSHTARALSPGTIYFFRVCSTNSAGDSTPVISRITLPAVPSLNRPAPRSWFVDSAASTSNLSGESWPNAWQDFSSINWHAIQAGDTIFISGGTTSKTYTNGLHIAASGAPDNPVTFRVGADIGHSGRVVIHGIVSFHQFRWVTIDGSKHLDFVPTRVEDISSNINFEIVNARGTGIYATSPQGLRMRWLEIHGAGASSRKGFDHGIRLNATNPAFPPEAIEIAYCHIHNNWVDGINVPVNSDPSYGDVVVHHNLIELNGDDGIQIAGGVDVHDNIIRKRRLGEGTGHPDGIQSAGSYYRIYNNDIYDFANALIFMEVSRPTNGFIHIYNNVFSVEDIEPPYGVSITCNALGYPGSYISTMENQEIHIVNNTFVGLPSAAITLARSSSNEVGLVRMRSSRVANNIVHNCSYRFPDNGTSISLKGQPNSGFDFTVSDFPFEGNVVSGPCKRIQYATATPHATSEDLNRALGFNLNVSATPAFHSISTRNYRLASGDTAAAGRGLDLSSFVNAMPGLIQDKDGRTRANSTAWDAGAFNASATPAAPKNLRTTRAN